MYNVNRYYDILFDFSRFFDGKTEICIIAFGIIQNGKIFSKNIFRLHTNFSKKVTVII